MHRTLRRLTATLGVMALAATGAAAPAGATSTWITYHADTSRSGVDPSEASLSPAHAAWSADLGGAVYGQPVVADGRVFAATEGNRVVAIDPHSGQVLWSQSLGTPVASSTVTGCGDIFPLGVTSTPVIDTATHTLYVVAEISDGGSAVHHQLFGFDTYTGGIALSENIDPPLAAGEHANHLLQRAALALGNGRVYVAYGGNYGDCNPYHGWIVGVNETGPPNQVLFNVTPAGTGGAIWEAGSGPAIDSSGDVYVSTGNPNSGAPGYSESVVKLSPTLTPLYSFQDTHATGDMDLATNNPVLLPNGNLFAVGKTDIGFVLRQSDLGLVASIPGICGSDPDGGPAFDAATNTIYVPCSGGGIQAVNLTSNTLGAKLSGADGAPIIVGGTDLWAAQTHSTSVRDFSVSSGAVTQTLTTASSTPSFASPSAALGLLLVGTTTGVSAFAGPAGVPPAPPPAPVPPECLVTPPPGGYLMTASDGGVFAFGGAPFCGSAAIYPLNAPVVGMAANRHGGYWLTAADGGVFPFATRFLGSMGATHLNRPVVGMAATGDGNGYWLVASDGGIFTFGDAGYHGSTGGVHLNQPVVGMSASATGNGYWLVASDGGVFTFGDAAYYGSEGGAHLNKPIVGMASTPDGHGYWLVASDGGVFSFGDAAFHGSAGALHLNRPIVSMAGTPSGAGYRLVASDGGVFTYGDATYAGSLGGLVLSRPVVGAAAP